MLAPVRKKKPTKKQHILKSSCPQNARPDKDLASLKKNLSLVEHHIKLQTLTTNQSSFKCENLGINCQLLSSQNNVTLQEMCYFEEKQEKIYQSFCYYCIILPLDLLAIDTWCLLKCFPFFP